MLKREITSLEDLQDVKSILYENEKIYMPDYYLKEDSLTPKSLEMAANRDFVGQLKVSAGAYSDLLCDGIVGKAFDRDNKVIVRLIHENYNNERVNNVDTGNNINTADIYYSTKYDFVDAVYRVNGDFSYYGNPYPEQNYFKKTQAINEALSSAGYSFSLGSYLVNALLQYQYMGDLDGASAYVYKENRTSLKASVEKDVDLYSSKVKLMSSLDGWHANQYMGQAVYDNNINMNLLVKGIMYLEPWVVQLGFRFQDYKFTTNYFSADPYIKVYYDILPDLSAYASYTPEMKAPDYFEVLPGSFIIASNSVKPSTDNENLKAGLNFSIAGVFCNSYFGYRSIKDNIYIDTVPGANAFTLYNNDLDYSFAGIEIETIKLKDLSLSTGYEYRNIIHATTPSVTDMPNNELNLKLSFDVFEWTFKTSAALRSAAYGTSSLKMPAYALLNGSVSRKINDFITVEGYINNILNNNYYLLYYYKEKFLNLGIGVILNF